MAEATPVAASASLVPPTLKRIAMTVASIGGLLLLALPVVPVALPAWVGLVVFCGTAIASFLGGLALPSFAGGKVALPLALVPSALALAALLTQQSTTMPEGTLKSGMQLGAALLFALAGKAIPLSEPKQA